MKTGVWVAEYDLKSCCAGQDEEEICFPDLCCRKAFPG